MAKATVKGSSEKSPEKPKVKAASKRGASAVVNKLLGKSLRLQNRKLALRANSGLALGTIYPLSAMRNFLGRSVDLAVPVDDAKVSRVHAAIDQQNGFLYLVDLGSTNGTYLNEVRVHKSERLKVGDRVRVGSATFAVELLENAKTRVTANWKEATRAIVRGEPGDRVAPPAALALDPIEDPRLEIQEIETDAATIAAANLESVAHVHDQGTRIDPLLRAGATFKGAPRLENARESGLRRDGDVLGVRTPELTRTNFFITPRARWLSLTVALLLVVAALISSVSRV